MRKQADTVQSERQKGQRIARAFHLIEENKLIEASMIFMHELEINPEELDCRVGMALIHYKNADNRQALEILHQVLDTDPQHALASRFAGIIHFEMGELNEAKPFVAALAATEPNPYHYRNYAYILATQGDIEPAIKNYEASLELQPDLISSLVELAQLWQIQGEHSKASALLSKALALSPRLNSAITGFALSMHAQGDTAGALEWLSRQLIHGRDNAELLTTMAHILQQSRQSNEAKNSLEQALADNPHYIPALLSMANLLYGEGDYMLAELYYQEVLNQGDNLTALINLANIAIQRKEWREAKRYLGRALTLTPDSATALTNLGSVYHNLADYESEASCYQAALNQYASQRIGALTAEELFIGFQACKYNYARLQLLQGDWENGFINFDARKPLFPDLVHLLPNVPYFNGKQDISGKDIYLLCESEISDSLACVRFTKLVKRLGARTHLVSPKGLKSLLATVPGVDNILDDIPDKPLADSFQVSVVDLPYIFGIDPNHMEPLTPYLIADTTLANNLRQGQDNKNFKHIGVYWQNTDLLPFEKIATVCTHSNAVYYPLGATPPREKLKQVDQWILATGKVHDYATLASLIATLDLVIMVDGPIAHLCGSLNVPGLLVLPLVPNWRWQLQRQDSPWYPSLHLLRQSRLGDWDDVIKQLKHAIEERFPRGGAHG